MVKKMSDNNDPRLNDLTEEKITDRILNKIKEINSYNDANELSNKNLLNRLKNLNEDDETIIKISSLKLTNYRFFYGDDEENNKFDFDGKNVLIYGENGSGKSSLYKAIELLTKKTIEKGYFQKEANIFVNESTDYDFNDVYIRFLFSNNVEYIFNKDSEETELFESKNLHFVEKLHIFKPMLDYKKLLRLYYTSNEKNEMNIYSILEETLRDYPLEDKTTIFEKDPFEMIVSLNKVLDEDLIEYINDFIKYFDFDFQIEKFIATFVRDKNNNTIPSVNMSVNFKDTPIVNYHTFLNEARLSALAISIYFASIKKLFSVIENDCMKLLVLDDLLISLDMSNRLKLLKILKEEFYEFQILFFTHDKELFEIYKDKLDWKKYEIYCDNSTNIPKPIIKKVDSNLQRAKYFYLTKEYDISASFLRKEFEKILKNILSEKLKNTEDTENIKLKNLIDYILPFTSDSIRILLDNLNRDTKHILNPSSHDDNRNIYSEELENTIIAIEELSKWNPQIKKILSKYNNMKLTFKDKSDKTIEYMFNLKDNLYIYKNGEQIELSKCECIGLYYYEADDKNKGIQTKRETPYSSLFEVYKAIFEYKKLKLEANYYKYFNYRNDNGEWAKLTDIMKYK